MLGMAYYHITYTKQVYFAQYTFFSVFMEHPDDLDMTFSPKCVEYKQRTIQGILYPIILLILSIYTVHRMQMFSFHSMK